MKEKIKKLRDELLDFKFRIEKHIDKVQRYTDEILEDNQNIPEDIKEELLDIYLYWIPHLKSSISGTYINKNINSIISNLEEVL